MGNIQSPHYNDNSDQTIDDKFGENTPYSINKKRHQQLKAYYAGRIAIPGSVHQEINSKMGSLVGSEGSSDNKYGPVASGSYSLQQSVDDSYRESSNLVDDDPYHHQGDRYLFLEKDANEKLRENKFKVKYVFEDKQAPVELPKKRLSQLLNRQ